MLFEKNLFEVDVDDDVENFLPVSATEFNEARSLAWNECRRSAAFGIRTNCCRKGDTNDEGGRVGHGNIFDEGNFWIEVIGI